jgi:hypothetical protein
VLSFVGTLSSDMLMWTSFRIKMSYTALKSMQIWWVWMLYSLDFSRTWRSAVMLCCSVVDLPD